MRHLEIVRCETLVRKIQAVRLTNQTGTPDSHHEGPGFESTSIMSKSANKICH